MRKSELTREKQRLLWEDAYGRKSGSDQAVFTPNDANNYNTVTRTSTVKVTKATPVIAEKRRFN